MITLERILLTLIVEASWRRYPHDDLARERSAVEWYVHALARAHEPEARA